MFVSSGRISIEDFSGLLPLIHRMNEQAMSLPILDADPAAIRTRSHDPALVDSLVQQHYPHVQRFALSILNDPDEAEDAAQEALIAAVGSLGKFRGDSSFKTWLFGITLNVCRGRIRKQRMRSSVTQALQMAHLVSGSAPSPEDATARMEMDGALWKAVDGLDEGHRTVVIMKYVHELPVRDIARIMGINEGTVHSRLHYARKTLAQRLAEHHAMERGAGR